MRRLRPLPQLLPHRSLTVSLAVSSLALAALTACAPAEDKAATGTDPEVATATTPAAEGQVSAECQKGSITGLKQDGMLTVGTDSPAYDPWFSGDDPTNGKGYESAVTYAVAKELGFEPADVTWTTVPFNTSYAPGPKKFDFDINQISITPARAKVVDFSDPYYSAAQGVIALADKAGTVTSVADLKGLKLGAQTGTTSLTAIRDVIQPDQEPAVFEDTNAAKQALMNGQVDAILADLPTAFYITAVEIPKGKLIGQFQPETGQQETFGMLFEKGSPLVTCVNQALAKMTAEGTLAALEDEWLSSTVDVPVLK